MADDDQRMLDLVVKSAAVGGFAFMALAGWVIASDLPSIAPMIAGAPERDLLSALFVGGSLTKGLTVGTAFGFALAAHARRAPRQLPAMTAAPLLA